MAATACRAERRRRPMRSFGVSTARISRSAGKPADPAVLAHRVWYGARQSAVSGELFDSHGFLGLLLLFCRKLAKNRRRPGRPVHEGG
jgi:hypothetical protein